MEYRRLDARLMRLGARHLAGEHDFSSFRAAGCQARSPVRRVHRIDVNRTGERIVIDVHANAFLQHMVRNIAGTLVAVDRESGIRHGSRRFSRHGIAGPRESRRRPTDSIWSESTTPKRRAFRRYPSRMHSGSVTRPSGLH